MSDDTFENLIETGKLMLVVTRRDVRKWAAYIDRERALRGQASRVDLIREHLNALDNKVGPSTGVAGFFVGVTALMGNAMLAEPTAVGVVELVLFLAMAIFTLLSAVYAMSALGMEMPEDARVGATPAEFEFRLLQRLVYRARNHAWGLRSSQIAGLAAVTLAGGYMSEAIAHFLAR